MKRIILSALVALTALGGVASADHGRGGVRWQQGGVSVTPSRGYYHQGRAYNDGRGYYNRGYYNRGYGHVAYNRGYVRPAYRYIRRPIYVSRPVIRYRYTNYYAPPAVLVENYASMPGYFWVAGQWSWNGYEWIWTPGHYEPDPNAAGYYSNAYGAGYYDNPYYDPSYSY